MTDRDIIHRAAARLALDGVTPLVTLLFECRDVLDNVASDMRDNPLDEYLKDDYPLATTIPVAEARQLLDLLKRLDKLFQGQ